MISPPVIFPGGFGIRRITEREVTDLPDPDSPTMPMVSPLDKVKEISLTALTVSSSVRNSVTKFFTSSKVSFAIIVFFQRRLKVRFVQEICKQKRTEGLSTDRKSTRLNSS